MAKLTLDDIVSGYKAKETINDNNAAIEAAVENTLSRDGTAPNEMNANLDMNSYRVLNLPDAVSNQEPITLSQAASIAGVTNPLTQETVAAVLWPRTADEITAGVTPTDYAYPECHAFRYGAVGDDSTDNATAFTNLIAVAIQAKKIAYLPGGTYRIGSTITWDGAAQLVGSGMQTTLLKKTFATGNLFTITSDDAVVVRDMSITSTVTQTSGAYFDVDGGSASTLNTFSRFENLRIGTFYDGIEFNDCAQFIVKDCYFVETTHVCIQVGQSSALQPDNGDSMITGCVFATSDDTGTYCIRQYASGGLRIIGNKFLNHEYQYQGAFNNLTTSVLVITGNSFENPGLTNIYLDEIGTGSFGNIVISGNQFTSNGASGYGIQINDVYNFVISDNTFVVGASTTAAIFCNTGSEFYIAGNVIDGNGSGTGISIGSGASAGNIGINTFSNLSTNISNSSSTVSVARKYFKGSKTWDIANMATDGAVESTTVTVTGATTAGIVEGVQLSSLGANAIFLNGHISASDTVYVTAMNKTGGAVDPASGTLYVVVSEQQ